MNIQTIQYQDESQVNLIVVADNKSFTMPWPCRTWHAALIQAWLDAGNEIAPVPTPDPAEVLNDWRESTKVSAFQARAALLQAGYMPDIETLMADPATDPLTVMAWESAQFFRRMSPTVLELAPVLGIGDTELDDLFRFALTIYA
ncbi:hypothetical protein SAMN05661010_02507 [Modicisalibacter muralis]|uniref:Uncharacterized protein n=1 Tax=Modicisalibacter muralis TaxID=119000 RepID=A0A1G9MTP2_9GAMM|nr:hypothetical protein [Halomonas muralis]SDL77381.1 hypothetical protein SAMN05661010_02507 [Halomonas muralis]